MKHWVLTGCLAVLTGCSSPGPSPEQPPQPVVEDYELSDAGVFFKIDGVWHEAPPPPEVWDRAR